MALPKLDQATGNLPPGIHPATLAELESAFGWNKRREELLDGLRRALASLRAAGCKRVYVDGSFVTAKDHPGDFDGCWEAAGVDSKKLDPTLLTFDNLRAAQRAKYGGEMFIAHSPADPQGTVFLDFFQIDKGTGAKKGIVAINL